MRFYVGFMLAGLLVGIGVGTATWAIVRPDVPATPPPHRPPAVHVTVPTGVNSLRIEV